MNLLKLYVMSLFMGHVNIIWFRSSSLYPHLHLGSGIMAILYRCALVVIASDPVYY